MRCAPPHGLFSNPRHGTQARMVPDIIQLALTPAFLLVATGSILNVITGRLARAVDRARKLQVRYAETEGEEHVAVVRELRRLDQRIQLISWSVTLSVACGIVVCIMVALLFLFGSGYREALTPYIAGAFIAAMLLLLASLVAFLIEVRMAVVSILVPLEMLERTAANELGILPALTLKRRPLRRRGRATTPRPRDR